MTSADARIGVDIGGTFTDVVLEVGEDHFSTKVLTTYTAPEDAILDGIGQVCSKSGITATTEGFRDVIEMRTESRFEQYDLNLVLPDPLLSRQRRYTLHERIGASGDVLIPLERSDVEDLADELAAAEYESIAVGFLHSYVNPAHEQMVRDVLAAKLPNVLISLSSDVSPQMREYERFNTTIANAFIQPLMKSYLDRLQHGLDKVLSFDMGGTTAKICLIKDFTPKTARVFEVARSYRFKKGSGMPISIPVIEMVEIGAGGGSLAHVDAMRQIRVGPESAGSEPGPACYGRDGKRPAVTDADLGVRCGRSC